MRYDIHTHILPGMDDGARDGETAAAMLRLEGAQGVEAVALISHYYRDREAPARFLARRREAAERLSRALEALPPAERQALPRAALAAEVAWMPNLSRWDELEQFCIGNTEYFLLELPFHPWGSLLLDQLYELLACTRFIPVIAHLERYFAGQKRAHIQELYAMGLPIQFSASSVLELTRRGGVLRALRSRSPCLLASDCHDLDRRRPDLGPAGQVLERKLDAGIRADMEARAGAILRNAAPLA